MTANEELMDELAEYYDDPLGHVMFSYPWDTDRSIQIVKLSPKYRERFNCEYGPDDWACEFLDDLGAEIRDRNFDGQTPVMPISFSTASGHGIGKSTLVAWLIKFIMDTRPFCKGMVTAVTGDQLKTKTWAELAKWHKLSLTSHLFTLSSGRGSMSLVNNENPATWRTDAVTCRDENSEAFQGLHAANSTPFYIFDEASGISDVIWNARAGGSTDGEPMTFDFGNPTRKSGMFYENCIGKYKHNFKVRCIDSRSVKITNKNLIARWEKDWGVEDDRFKVKVMGMFPSSGSIQFMDSTLVEDAMKRKPVVDRFAPLIIGVDVARFGDDETVIYPRIGMDAQSFPPERYSKLDTHQITARVTDMIARFRKLGVAVSAIFVDASGGYGGGVVDNLRLLGYNPVEVQFGKTATDHITYRYVMDELWGKMREAIRTRLCLPSRDSGVGEVLHTQLTQREFGYTTGTHKLCLESKDDMKERLKGMYASPDVADALACTFYQEVAPKEFETLRGTQTNQAQSEYDPLDAAW